MDSMELLNLSSKIIEISDNIQQAQIIQLDLARLLAEAHIGLNELMLEIGKKPQEEELLPPLHEEPLTMPDKPRGRPKKADDREKLLAELKEELAKIGKV
jgi:hypothetical protein